MKHKLSYNAPVTLTFVLICLAALLLNRVTGGWANRELFSVYRCSLLDPLAYVRMIGHIFGHSGWSHLFNNVLMILLLGPGLEEKYGSRTLLVLILLTGVCIGLVQFVFFPGTALSGASGIVFMLIILSSFTSFRANEIPVTAILVFCLYVGQEIYNGIALADNVSQMAHIAGGIGGAVYGFALGRGKK